MLLRDNERVYRLAETIPGKGIRPLRALDASRRRDDPAVAYWGKLGDHILGVYADADMAVIRLVLDGDDAVLDGHTKAE